jgi:hypothetical protein
MRGWPAFLLAAALAPVASARQEPDLKKTLAREIVGPHRGMDDVQAYIDPRIPAMPDVRTVAEWEKVSRKLRADVLDTVVFRGEAAAWRTLETKVEWLGELEGGAGYRLRKLRYEAVPGLWIPAILYAPEKLSGKAPVYMAVNGHDGNGKAAEYKQIRCINLAKRGVISLNVEWLGMGQLRGPGYGHYLMNQLDLCGTSGLAPFYLSMKRGLDVLLSLENADPARVGVSGLSGGGWQTIFITSLDERVTLSNPVAGYSSFRTRLREGKDLGDSEQTPCDLATVADYAHLTAMRAPRPTLLTFNGKDNCCFEAGYALQPLKDAALPIFRLYQKEANLTSHVNHDPGDHNYGLENRQAFYRVVGEHFFPGDRGFDPREIPCKEEVKTAAQLAVDLPPGNATFLSLAKSLAADLPREKTLDPAKASARRARLREVVRAKEFRVAAEKAGSDGRASFWRLRLDDAFTIPAVELAPADPKGTTVIFSETGRAGLAADVDRLLAAGQRVIAVDPFYYGESKIEKRDFLFALLVAATGERPLGLQASQIAAVARWAGGPVTLAAVGPRSSLVALVAGALEEKAIVRVDLQKCYGSLKEILEQGLGVDKAPELFCFGLLEAFDVKQIAALVAPRPVTFAGAADRARAELGDLKAYYAALGSDFDPLK